MEPGHRDTLTQGSGGTGHPGSFIRAPLSMAEAHLSPLQDSTHLGCGGNPGVLVPRPCSTVQHCQGTSVGTTAGLISKPLHQLGEPASHEEHTGTLSLCSPPQTSTGFTVPAAQHPQLPSGNAGQAAGRERSRLHTTGDMTPSLISPGEGGGGEGRGQIASSRLRCTSAGKS